MVEWGEEVYGSRERSLLMPKGPGRQLPSLLTNQVAVLTLTGHLLWGGNVDMQDMEENFERQLCGVFSLLSIT